MSIVLPLSLRGERVTTRELKQLYYLEREIEDGERRLAELKEKGYSARTSKLEAIPGGGNGSSVETVGTEIADFENALNAKKAEVQRLNDFIDGTEDSLIRQILTYKYRENCSWYSVARKVGGYNTNESVRKACARYLERSSKK